MTDKDTVSLRDQFGPWRVWYDPPPISSRNCDWSYQHEDAEDGSPSWMSGYAESRDACLSEIIESYEDRLQARSRNGGEG